MKACFMGLGLYRPANSNHQPLNTASKSQVLTLMLRLLKKQTPVNYTSLSRDLATSLKKSSLPVCSTLQLLQKSATLISWWSLPHSRETTSLTFLTLKQRTRAVLPLLKEGDLYVIESTSPVGTTEAMAKIIFSERPELEGKIFIAYCPERVLPGNVIYELVHNDRVIGGLTPESTDKAIEFYSQFVQGTLHKTNSRTAELCKLTENSSRDVQIAFANELSLICDKAGINVWELINLANKHPRVNILQPGCGVGGHCIAVDPYFITADFPAESKIIADARELNNYKSFWCAEKVKNTMLEFELKNHRKPTVAMMGLAFKPNIDDLRESPAKYITTKVMQSCNNADILVVEPNVKSITCSNSPTTAKRTTKQTSLYS